MLAVAISLLFGLAAFAAVAVIHVSLVGGALRARQIVRELSASDRRVVRQVNRASPRPAPARQARFAVV